MTYSPGLSIKNAIKLPEGPTPISTLAPDAVERFRKKNMPPESKLLEEVKATISVPFAVSVTSLTPASISSEEDRSI